MVFDFGFAVVAVVAVVVAAAAVERVHGHCFGLELAVGGSRPAVVVRDIGGFS